MVATEKNYINNGSTALQPKAKPLWDNNRELKKAENEKLREQRQLKLKNQALVILSIALVFTLGTTVIYRYSKIYTMQNELTKNNASATNIQRDNENLRLLLIQYNSINVVQDKATALNMGPVDTTKEVSLDYDKDTLKASKSSASAENEQPFFNKIIDAIIK